MFTVASLQRLRVTALVPAPADCEVRSITKVFNAQSIEPIVIHRQLCQVYGHTRPDDQQIGSMVSTSPAVVRLGGV